MYNDKENYYGLANEGELRLNIAQNVIHEYDEQTYADELMHLSK